jgi:hypothetical protein
MSKTQLHYKTFDQLLSEVTSDFHTFEMEGMIDPAQLIKVAQRVNYELGLRIHQSKDVILDINRGKAKLPLDFYVLNYANLVGKYTVTEPVIHGSHVEERILDPQPTSSDPCRVKPCISPCGEYMHLVQTFKTETRTYEEFYPLQVGKGKMVREDCPNTTVLSKDTAVLRDGYIFTNVETGKIHINYQGNLEDHEGNLLVLDHPLVNEFYEYALKQRILENLYINGEDVAQRMQLIEQRIRGARNNALTIVNTPDYAELKGIWETNRKAQYGKYYNMFKR